MRRSTAQQAESGSGPGLSVPRWSVVLAGWQARFPGFWIGLGNLETRMLAEQLADVSIDRPIYISGLARSGSTILLELLARHPHLATHRYRDFPPVLAPWFWNRFLDRAMSRSAEKAGERAHGDRIQVTTDSPEAFEEVIWMAFFSHLHDPTANAALQEDTWNAAFEDFYRDHLRKLLLLRDGRRYLSKGNYNITRLPYLMKLFPDARFLVPIRDPVWHIASLMRQHRRFCSEHERDPRLERHMSRSGHFEFGRDRRPVNSGTPAATHEVRELWNSGRETEGWALYWNDIYGHVADVLEKRDALRGATLIIDYDEFCKAPENVMKAVVTHCELDEGDVDLVAEARTTVSHPTYYRPAFNDGQLALIRERTAEVKSRLDRLAEACRRY